jgi:chemotaxis family two-component system response regulator PixG
MQHNINSMQPPSMDLNIARCLSDCEEKKLTGQLHIRSTNNKVWKLKFLAGRLIGEEGSGAFSRWIRQISDHCPDIKPEEIDQHWRNQKSDEQKTLMQFLQQKNIGTNQLIPFMKGCLVEVVFDILQCETQNQLSYEFRAEENLDLLSLALVPVKVNLVVERVTQLWQEWQEAGLAPYSPSGVLKIQDPESLQAMASSSAYRNLSHLINGKRTLRDLAKHVNRDPAVVGRSLLPYLKAGLICLHEEELGLDPALSLKDSPQRTNQSLPLVAYVEDGALDSQVMHRVLTQLNCRPLIIPDPMQALPMLIEQKPVMIFLDLVMPVVNGYELCSQLRRIAAFKETPITIVTSSDGIVDRVRAKVVGASSFIAKPIALQDIRAILQKNGILGEVAVAS